jgi:putative redox protein
MSAPELRRTMEAAAARDGAKFKHTIRIRDHAFSVDEPPSAGGTDAGPDPQELLAASLAGCTAITLEMYAARKGWDIGRAEVDVAYTPAESGGVTTFELVLRLPDELSADQVEKLRAVAAKCPVHRTLDGEVTFVERLERVHVAA